MQIGRGGFDTEMDRGKNGFAPTAFLDAQSRQAFLLITIESAANRIFMIGLDFGQ